jgi:hypothetical protein
VAHEGVDPPGKPHHGRLLGQGAFELSHHRHGRAHTVYDDRDAALALPNEPYGALDSVCDEGVGFDPLLALEGHEVWPASRSGACGAARGDPGPAPARNLGRQTPEPQNKSQEPT